MARHEDRHVGRRENVWFTAEDHERMLAATRSCGEPNKSVFVRAAVASYISITNYISALNRRGETKHKTTKGNK